MNLEDLKLELQKAIDVREGGDLKSSRKLFDDLVAKVKKLLAHNSSRDFKYFYVTLMGEYVIQYRLEGKRKLAEAFELGQDIYKFNQDEDLKNFLGPRSVAHTLQDLGDFEDAEVFSRELISIAKDNPFRQGDEMGHLALGLFRTGKIKEAKGMIEKALKQMSEYGKSERYPSVPYSSALIVKALILNAEKSFKDALGVAKEALALAKKDKLHFRIIQAEKLVEYLSSRASKN